MRTDLPSMQSGRAVAQASHASNAFIKEWGNLKGKVHRHDVNEWSNQTLQGFGTVVVLSMTKEQIETVLKSNIIPHGRVIDPDYVVSVSSELKPYLNSRKIKIIDDENNPSRILLSREEMTCAYIFGDKETLKPLLGEYPLYA